MINIPKFRAWDKKSKLMAKVISLSFYENESPYKGSEMESFIYYEDLDITSLRPFDQIELMQFTGLSDKNGVDIFSDYIVKPDRGKPFVVKNFIEGQGIIKEVSIHHGGHSFDGIYSSDELEVIGNIWEDNELLGG